MKDETSKLLLGLGVGTLVGVVVGYLVTDYNRKKLGDNMHEMGDGIKEGVRSAFSKMRRKAAANVCDYAERAEVKVEEWEDELRALRNELEILKSKVDVEN